MTTYTGPLVRMMQVMVLEANGKLTPSLMEVEQVGDEFVNLPGFTTREQQTQEMLDEWRACRLGIQEWISAGALPRQVFNLIEVSHELRHDADDSIADEE